MSTLATPEPIAVSWSGGKDSMLMLYALHTQPEFAAYKPTVLLTCLTEDFQRISMHGVRADLLRQQVAALGMELLEIWIPWPCTNEIYEQRMQEACDKLKARGIHTVAFGDLFLEDVRAYRERNMEKATMRTLYPLWGKNTQELSHYFIEQGFKAKLCCVDTAQIDARFAGHEYDETLLQELPSNADPCGEKGEFHSFVYDGPGFAQPVACATTHTLERGQFVYAEIVPASELA
jgi:uncharacterized protein (TIGR00290 family)